MIFDTPPPYFATALNSTPPGIKTLPMLIELQSEALIGYDPLEETLLFQGTTFHILQGSTQNISQLPLLSFGSEPLAREIISFDPKRSTFLKNKYSELRAYLQTEKNLSVEAVLRITTSFVREELFSKKSSSERKVLSFIDSWMHAKARAPSDFALTESGTPIPVIPLDDFLKKKVGVCRHYAFVMAYLLDSLIKEQPPLLPPGAVHYVRDLISRDNLDSGHAWVLYIPSNAPQAWHVDPLWGVLSDCNDKDSLALLVQLYGKDTIERERGRFLSSHW